MISVLPAFTVRPLDSDDLEAVIDLVNRQAGQAIYSQPFTPAGLAAELQQASARYTVRWLQRRLYCAWRAGELVGFLDVATGLDEDHCDLPDHQPVGLIRHLALTERSDIIEETVKQLLGAAEPFWRSQNVQHIIAFPHTTGYQNLQGGTGILSGDWSEQVRAFTSNGFIFSQRYYLMQRSLQNLVDEDVPMTDLRLEFQRIRHETSYRLYYRLVELIAVGRVVGLTECGHPETTHLLDFTVSEGWRNRNIGKWLLRRMINDATQAGLHYMIAFPALRHPIMISLLGQQGFVEENFRGYTLEKGLI